MHCLCPINSARGVGSKKKKETQTQGEIIWIQTLSKCDHLKNVKNDNIQVFHLSITVVWKFLNRPHYWLCNKHILNKTSFTHTHTQTHACACACACVLLQVWENAPKTFYKRSVGRQQHFATASLRDSRNSVSGAVHWDCFWWSSSNCVLNILNLRNPTTSEHLWQKLLEKNPIKI